MNKFIMMIFMACASCFAQAQSYYIDAVAGSDAWSGTLPSCAGCNLLAANPGPWRSIAKVNAATLQPGDSVLFSCGGMWRETLVVPSSGTSAQPITFSSYPSPCPTGAKPQITGSEQVTGWAQYAGNIYVANAGFERAPRNLIPNGNIDFEFAPWFLTAPANSGGSVTWNAADANGSAGSGSLAFVSGAVDPTSNDHHIGSTAFQVNEGKTYRVSFKMRADAGKTVGNIKVVMSKIPWAPYCVLGPVATTGDGTWKTFTYDTACAVPDNGIAPNNETFNAGLYIYLDPSYQNQGSVAVYIDDISVTQTSPYVAPVQQVFVDGQYIKLAHYPNKGYLPARPDSVFLAIAADSSSKSSLTAGADLSLSAGQDIVGAGLHIRTQEWLIEDRKVTAYDPTTNLISWAGDTEAPIAKGWGYYLDNKLWMLDEPGEWYYESDPSKSDYQKLYVWLPDGSNPLTHVIEASIRDQGIYSSYRTGIIANGLQVVDAGMNGVESYRPIDFTFDDLDILNSGINGIKVDGGLPLKPTANRLIQNSSVSRSVRQGIYFERLGNVTVTKNAISDSGNVGNPLTSHAAITSGYLADSMRISNNTVIRSGYLGISFGPNSTISNNDIEQSCLVLNDCGAIYAWNPNPPNNVLVNNPETYLTGNVITDVVGGHDGEPFYYQGSYGIYLDNLSNHVWVDGNTIANADIGVYMNSPYNNTIVNNVIYGGRVTQLAMNEGPTKLFGQGGSVFNNSITNNIFFPTNGSFSLLLSSVYGLVPCLASPCTPDFSSLGAYFGVFDSNTYGGFYSDRIVQERYNDATSQQFFHQYTLDNWKLMGKDTNSTLASPYSLVLYAPLPNSTTYRETFNAPDYFSGTKDNWWTYATPPATGLTLVGKSQAECLTLSSGGCASFTPASDPAAEASSAYTPLLNLSLGKKYLVQFMASSVQRNQDVFFGFGDARPPYAQLGLQTFFVADPVWRRYAFTFTANRDISTAEAFFTLYNTARDPGFTTAPGSTVPDQTIRIDNFRLQEATPNVGDPDNSYILVNNTASPVSKPCPAQDVTHCADYTDMSGASITWPVAVAPYSSKIVLWTKSPQRDSDHDGIADATDGCPQTVNPTEAEDSGCAPVDLALTRTSTGIAYQGKTTTYHYTITNNGPDQAGVIRFTDTIGGPAALVTKTNNDSGSCSYDATTRTVNCSVASMAAGASAVIMVKVVPSAAGNLTDAANVVGAATDTTPSNNMVSGAITVY